MSGKPSREYLSELEWKNTNVVFPETMNGERRNLLTGEKHGISGAISVSEIFGSWRWLIEQIICVVIRCGPNFQKVFSTKGRFVFKAQETVNESSLFIIFFAYATSK